MRIFDESKIRFEFDERNWDVIQYDAEKSDFRKFVHLSETKAVDFVGIYNSNTFVLFEIKSFRGYMNQPGVQARLTNSMEELSTEVAQKVKDTISVISGFNRTLKTPFWHKSEEIISNDNKQVIVIAWIEENNTKQKKVEMGTRLQKLKKKLSWLSSDIYIENIKERHFKFEGFNAFTTNS